MKRLGLRSTLLWPVVLTLLVGALALGLFVERSVRSDLVRSVDEELIRVGAANGGAPPRGGNERVGPPATEPTESLAATTTQVPVSVTITPGGEIGQASRTTNPFSDEQLRAFQGTEKVMTIDEPARYRVRTEPFRGGATLVTALSLDAVDDSVQSLRRSLILGGIGLVAIQSIVVWFIANRAARPVSRLSVVSRRIADGELDATIGDPEGPLETAELAADLERMVTRLRSTIDERERSASDAHAARANMERFLADASHELRTPLTALKGYSDLYAQGALADDESVDRAMGRIGSESDRMHRLVVDMLQLVRHSAEAEPLDLTSIVVAAVEDLRAAHPNRLIELAVPAHPVSAIGDRHRLFQAVLNLGANACQHTPDATTIEIGLVVIGSGADSQARIAVRDHGLGIDPAQIDGLFQPFRRGDASRSRKTHDGAGLGLAIVQQIAEQHGATITVEQTPGGGATFILGIAVERDTSGPKL